MTYRASKPNIPQHHAITKGASAKLLDLIQRAFQLHSSGKLDAALTNYNQILKMYPRHFDALQLKGALMQQKGNSEEAVSLFIRALEINAKNASTWFNLGLAYESLGQYQDAVIACEKALCVNPLHRDAADKLVHLRSHVKDRPETD